MIEVISPCFNEGQNIPIFVNTFKNCFKQHGIDDFLITIVDDGSSENTKKYYKLYEKDDQVTIILLARNYGHQIAVLAGLESSKSDFSIVCDLDLQDPPSVGIKMYKLCILEHKDFVIGVRAVREGETKFKLATANLFYQIVSFLSDDKLLSNRSTGDFYCMSKRFRNALIENLSTRLYIRGTAQTLGFNQAEIRYDREARKFGKTKFSLKKMISFALSGILSSSTKPLRITALLSILGFSISIAISFIIAILRIFHGTTTPGWSFIVISLYLCTSLVLFCLAIMSEYMAILIKGTQRSKRYYIKNKI